MTDLHRLREHLGAAGIADGTGEFSIDAGRARDKLRDFQLADPRLYVALIVQAATLASAGRIDFTLDSDDLIATFDGHPFAADDLADLYAHVFRDPRTPAQRALQRLALALNGAMALRPRYVRLTAIGPGGGADLTLRPDRPDRLEPLPPGLPQTRVHVKEPPRAGRISAYVTSVLEEARILRRACAFARLVVTLNGAPISGNLDDVPLLHPSALGGGRRGVAGLLGGKTYPFDDTDGPPPEGTIVDVLLHGVHLTRVPMFGPSEVRAIVDGDDLRDDLSLTAVVTDDAYAAALSAALSAADRSVAARLRAARGRDEVRHASNLVERFLLARGGDARGDSPSLTAFRALPRWSTLDGERRSADELRAGDPQLLVAEAMAWTVRPPEAARIVLVDAHERQLAEAVFGPRIRDVTTGLARLETRAANERAWRARPRAPTLALPDAVLRVRVYERGLIGEIAVRPGAAGPSHLTLVLDGCAFASLDLPLPLDGVSAVFEGDFVPSDLLDRVDPCPALAGVAVLLLRHLDALVQAVASAYEREPAWQRYVPPDALLAYAAALARGDALVGILRTFGFTPQDAVHLGPFADLPPPGLPLDPERAPALARVRLVTTSAEPASLVDLARIRADRGRLPVLARRHPHAVDEPCVLVDGRDRALLTAIFGDVLEDMSQATDKSHGRRRFLARPRIELELRHALDARVDDRDLAVVAALEPPPLSRASRLALRVLVKGRHLTALDVDVGLPGVVAIADDSTFELADEDFTGVTDGPRRAHLLRTVATAIAALVTAALDLPDGERPPGAAALLAAALALVFGDVGRRRLDDHARALAPEIADERLRSTIREEARGGWSDAATLTGRLRLLLLDHLARLRHARVFPTLRGDHLSLDDLVAGAAADRPDAPLLHAPFPPASYPNLPERPAILAIAPSQHHVLHALFGDAQSELDRRAVERRGRAHLERRRPPAVDALVRVDIADGGVHGFIGLAPDPEAAGGIVCERDGWLVGVATVNAPLPLVGRLAGDLHADADAPGRPLDASSEDRVVVGARAHLPALLLALADAWEAAPTPTLAAWILKALARVDADDPPAVPGLAAALGRLAELPIFPTSAGLPRSYRELRALDDEAGGLRYVDRSAPHGHSEYPVLAADSLELPRLRALFPRLRPFESAPADAAPALPASPVDALARAPLAVGDLRGELWLGPAGEPDLWVTLHLGHEGHELAVVVEPHPLPAAVVLHLARPDDRPDAPRRAALLDLVDAAHQDLVATYVAALDRALADPDPAPIDARLRRHLDVDPPALRAYLLGLHRTLDALHRTGAPLPPGVDAVRRALLQARIIELPSGRLVRPGLAAEPPPAPAPAQDPPPPAPPSPAPPSPAPPPPSPAALLVGAVRSELQRVRGGVAGVVDEAMLETLEIADAPALAALVDGRVVLGRGHPVVVRALADHERAAVLVSFLASAVYTALNAHHEAITDRHEAEFHQAHAAHLLGA